MDASLVVKAVMLILVFLSLVGWLIIFQLSGKISATYKNDTAFEEWFWAGNPLPKLYQSVLADNDRYGLEQIFFVGYQAYLQLTNNHISKQELSFALERQFRIGLGRQQGHLEAGLPTLASISSVAPYIGLFGTVWGIMSAFIGLGDAQSVTLATVAPGIAEALIATAMGLFAAIPASLAFNHFTAKANRLYESRSLFCDELTGAIINQYTPKHTP